MKKPTIYFDTSIISAYWYEGADVAMLARRLHTREWWEFEREHFELWASRVSEEELRAGVYPRQEECVRMVQRLRYLMVTATVRDLIDEITRCKIVPAVKDADAVHLGLSASHGMDYLLTWNYAHMANPVVQAKLGDLCEVEGLIVPMIVSPESIPQVRLGKSIRRRR